MNFKYITTSPGLGGRIKQYAEDFVVSEIGKDYETNVLYLPNKKVVDIDWSEIFQKKGDNQFLILDLEKYNLSTTTAINKIARFLRISKQRINYAGLKDKRAITSQRISIYDPSQERVSICFFRDIKLYNPQWSNKRIEIGDLLENKFVVTIRNIDLSEDQIKQIVFQAFSEIEKNGLINYFGEQRFGGVREITHLVGKHFLKKEYKEGVLLYLTYINDLEKEDIKNARKELANDLNFKKHAAYFPTKTGYERAILNYLANHPDDFLGAIKVLPKSIQYLFIHAYQSYLFNELINLRFEKGYGLNQIDGDKVVNDEVYLPLFGFESVFSDGLAGDLEKEVLSKEGVSFKDFYNKDYGVLSSKGDWRLLRIKAKDLMLHEISADELNEHKKKAVVSFRLDKGQYATVVLRELIKQEFIG
ncbi:MAG TPA: tRNA pseudouridine(13) synthase TruD [Candidatus Diapherotrites archaeon]|nr:tRNA pseudouridine(13) synthase TruD [Candidatus Diapherotrites archaeon]